MPKPRERVEKILDWEELERAPNTPLVSSLGSTEEEVPSTTTEVDLVVQALAEQAGVADAGAASRLIAECRSVCSDATGAEIIDIIQEKAFAARCRRDVRNLIGFLLSTVPPVFDGQGIVSHRFRRATEAEAKRKIEEERKLEASRRDYYARVGKAPNGAPVQPGSADEATHRIGAGDSRLRKSSKPGA